MTRVSRAVEKGETAGFIKVLVDADSRAILGATDARRRAATRRSTRVLDLMYAGAPVETITRAVHIHPTVSELMPTTFAELAPL